MSAPIGTRPEVVVATPRNVPVMDYVSRLTQPIYISGRYGQDNSLMARVGRASDAVVNAVGSVLLGGVVGAGKAAVSTMTGAYYAATHLPEVGQAFLNYGGRISPSSARRRSTPRSRSRR